MFPKILSVGDLHADRAWYEWLRRQAPRFDLVCLPGDLSDFLVGPRRLPAQRRRILNELAQLAAGGTPVAVAEGNHDAVDPGWLCPTTGMESVLWPGASAAISAGSRRLIITLCPDTHFGGDESDRAVARLFASGAKIRDEEGLPWLVLHHEPPDATPICTDAIGSGQLAGLVMRHQPNLVICGHIHQAPFMRPVGNWYHRIGHTLLVNTGQMAKRRWPCHLLIDGDSVTWRAPGTPKETVRLR
ncbi:MAG: metallophosphoesterase [Verrucomicrobiae bacterium]|nr:metallophosphoesterase [Verrucomicrobiae bacterium]